MHYYQPPPPTTTNFTRHTVSPTPGPQQEMGAKWLPVALMQRYDSSHLAGGRRIFAMWPYRRRGEEPLVVLLTSVLIYSLKVV